MAHRIVFLICLLFPFSAYADPVSIVVAVASAAASAGVFTAAAFSWAAFGLSLALSAVSYAMSPKPKSNASSYASVKSSGSTQQFRQAVTARETVYGEVRKSGPIIYVTTTNDNKYLHMMIALASHEVQEIGEIIIDDVSIPNDHLDVNGNVTAGRYSGVMRIRKHFGSDTQTADTLAMAEISNWGSDHRLRGIAYIYVRLDWDRDKYPNGTPNFSAWIKGKKIYDPRTSSSYWSPNVPLFIRDYQTDASLGMAISEAAIDDDMVEYSANIADEYVLTQDLLGSVISIDTATDIITLSGNTIELNFGDKVRLTSGTIGGLSIDTDYFVIPYQRQYTPRIKLATTYQNALDGVAINLTSGTTATLVKKAENRYHGGGIIKSDVEPVSNLSEMILSMAGTVTNSGGKWKILAGAYRTPSVYLDENDLVGGIEIATKISKQDRFNRIQGVYTAFLNNGNPSDYPVVKNDTYQTQDGELILKTRDLAFTQKPHTAMRIAKAEMERMRQEISFTAKFKLTAFKVGIADNFYFSFSRYGWENKVFECVNWRITIDGNAPVIEMTCREMASSVYDWSNGEETQVDPAPNSNLPSIFDVGEPLSLAVFPVIVGTSGATDTYKFNFVWTQPVDQYVLNGGQYEIQFKESSETNYRPSFFIDGEQFNTDIYQVSPATDYDARIRSVNVMGIRSNWVALLGFNVGAPSGATDREDYGLFSESVTSSLDYGLFSDSISSSEDYGSFV
jgi:hypothetical protein